MNCKNHLSIEAKEVCVRCGKPLCNDCMVEIGGKYYCKECLEELLTATGEHKTILNLNKDDNNKDNDSNDDYAEIQGFKWTIYVIVIAIIIELIIGR